MSRDLVTIKNWNSGKNFTSWISTFKIQIIKVRKDMFDRTVGFDMEWPNSESRRSVLLPLSSELQIRHVYPSVMWPHLWICLSLETNLFRFQKSEHSWVCSNISSSRVRSLNRRKNSNSSTIPVSPLMYLTKNSKTDRFVTSVIHPTEKHFLGFLHSLYNCGLYIA
jgi:hypothetical protein